MVYLCFFYFFILILIANSVGQNECMGRSCKESDDFEIRFPFRIKEIQPKHCGYPGFDVSCSETKETVLELTKSAKLFIKSINYVSQEIFATPDSCLSKHILNLGTWYPRDYGLYNCTPGKRNSTSIYPIPCMSTRDFEVYAVDYWIDTIVLLSCVKLCEVSIVPYHVSSEGNVLRLHWTNPASGTCEAHGSYGRLKHNSSEFQIECYGQISKPKISKPQKGSSTPSLVSGSSTPSLVSGVVLGSLLLLVACIATYRKYRFSKLEKEYQFRVKKFLDDYNRMQPTRYSYADIKRMTNQFKDELGQGAYGNVFKGKLSDEILVAVKVLNSSKGNGEEFVNEVGAMGSIHHVNVVRLIGFCADGFRRALVYEYLPNDSLEKFITSADNKCDFLGWKRLQDIALGTARGIEYLHQGCDQRIVHFDIKPHNVLLDENFKPKISDFGLAKLCSKDQSAVSMTTARGTLGYIAPEVFSRNFGNVSYKSDVYSFGMLLIEMVGGRKNMDAIACDQIYYPEWIHNLVEGGEDVRLHIEEEGDVEIAKKLSVVGLWCIQWNPTDRPSMKTVLQMLEGEGNSLTMPPNPFSSAGSTKTIIRVAGRRRRPPLELEVISEIE